MVTNPYSPGGIVRADELRRPHGIQDESLVDHILDTLRADGGLYYEPLSQQSWTPDAHTLIGRVIDMTLERASQHVVTHGFRAERRKDVRVGMYEASRLVQEMPR